MIVIGPLTAIALALTYLLIGLLIVAFRLWKHGYEIKCAGDLIEFLLIAGTSAVLWPVLAWLYWFPNDKDDIS